MEDEAAARGTLANLLEDLGRVVLAAVVDEDQFVPISGEIQRLDQLRHALAEVRSFVVTGNDQREIRRVRMGHHDEKIRPPLGAAHDVIRLLESDIVAACRKCFELFRR